MTKYHSLTQRVYPGNTDCYGIVYHSNYLDFAEHARTEAIIAIGGNLAALQEKGILLVVRSCLLNCLAPARLNDVLEVRTQFKKPKRVKLEVTQTIVCEDRIIATLDVVLASVNLLGKPIKLDEELANTLWTKFGDH
jgi:acyl-CoA thioester hydrolase